MSFIRINCIDYPVDKAVADLVEKILESNQRLRLNLDRMRDHIAQGLDVSSESVVEPEFEPDLVN